MEIDVNVKVDFTDRAIDLVEGLVSAVVLAKTGLTKDPMLDEIMDAPVAKEDKPAKVTLEKPAKSTIEKPVELEEEDPNAKVKGDMLVALREVVNAVIKENADNRQKLKNWLTEHGLKKVPDCTFAQASMLMDFMDGLGGEDNA